MIKKQKITKIFIHLLLLSLALIFGIGTVSADPGIIYVDNTTGNDSWDGQSTTHTGGLNGPKLSIKNATGTVTSNGAVKIAKGIYSGVNNTGITIDRNMTIIGESQTETIISGTNTYQIFNINLGVKLILENLTITNATATYGAICNYGNLTVKNCTFTSNTAQDGAAAIFNSWDGICNVTGSTFTGNSANRPGGESLGGAIFQGGKGIFTITDSNFTNNTATFGGAICVSDRIIVENCTFTGNSAEEGGAIMAWAGADLYLIGCNFINNTANGTETYSRGGGAICTLCPSNIMSCSFVNNTAFKNGGAIFNRDYYNNTKINFNRFYNNNALNGNAIYSTAYSSNVENNWWGTNEPNTNWSNLINGLTPPTNWVILSVDATPTTITNGETSAINADLNHINGGGNLVGGHIPDGLITLEVPWGSLTNPGQHSITVNIINGAIIPVTFLANEGAVNPTYNPVKVTATADGYTTNNIESAYLTINEVLTFNKTVDNNRPNVGDTVAFTVIIQNHGSFAVNNILIHDIMPSGFNNVVITPSTGTYDPNSGIWALNLDAGETATLNLTGEITSLLAGKNTTNTATLRGTTNITNATIYVPQADIYIQITSNKNNPRVGETFTLTYKLGNNGPDNAQNVTITIPLPEGFVISKIKGDGNWAQNGNTITWTFNNVTVGDPYLYITGQTTKPGINLFSASIASDTFNINSSGVNSLNLNTVPQANAATTTSVNTVEMQNTGTPLTGIVLAILMVLGAFISTKKKQ